MCQTQGLNLVKQEQIQRNVSLEEPLQRNPERFHVPSSKGKLVSSGQSKSDIASSQQNRFLQSDHETNVSRLQEGIRNVPLDRQSSTVGTDIHQKHFAASQRGIFSHEKTRVAVHNASSSVNRYSPNVETPQETLPQ